MVKIKVCGITNAEDALAACDAGADMLGFVLAPEARKRNRYISVEDAAAIVARISPLVLSVGVVVNASLDEMRRLLQVFDRLQLHGDESPTLCAALGAQAFKAFQARPELTLEDLDAYPGSLCLLDAYAPESRGGTGRRCDWDFAARAARRRDIALAGGLTPDNVGEAVLRVRPCAVDVSGGVEAAPGKKDHEKIRLFVNNARKASLA